MRDSFVLTQSEVSEGIPLISLFSKNLCLSLYKVLRFCLFHHSFTIFSLCFAYYVFLFCINLMRNITSLVTGLFRFVPTDFSLLYIQVSHPPYNVHIKYYCTNVCIVLIFSLSLTPCFILLFTIPFLSHSLNPLNSGSYTVIYINHIFVQCYSVAPVPLKGRIKNVTLSLTCCQVWTLYIKYRLYLFDPGTLLIHACAAIWN